MPEFETSWTEEQLAVLERVRAQQGLESVHQAAEWLVKMHLRRSAKSITGRGRALYPVKPVRSK